MKKENPNCIKIESSIWRDRDKWEEIRHVLGANRILINERLVSQADPLSVSVIMSSPTLSSSYLFIRFQVSLCPCQSDSQVFSVPVIEHSASFVPVPVIDLCVPVGSALPCSWD